ncbi:hypothetical protein NLI96_g10697 [Meripilus lineatus]|uniref:Glycoside hydrolase family 76 protein n=1 Tax=Meripilus lineatus TaxID=2056292 RepID=A0AAD5UT48_9APHY|nr:hypothetical protein NLI96_g10697 [Physisporinus lineatus]
MNSQSAFMALSSYLFEATLEMEYRDAAELSAEFIKSQLFDGNIIKDGIDLSNCLHSKITLTYNSGYYIEGLAVYANVTNSPEWSHFLHHLINSSIKYSHWTGDNGIINEGPQNDSGIVTINAIEFTSKGIFMRGLYAAWSRSEASSSIAQLIKAFIIVQYNALMDLASEAGTYQFSPQWPGPPVRQFLPWGQLAALEVLNAVIGLANDTSESASITTSVPTLSSTYNDDPTQVPRTPETPTTQPSQSHEVKRTIIGVVVVSAILFVVALLGIFWACRRRRRRTVISSADESFKNRQTMQYTQTTDHVQSPPTQSRDDNMRIGTESSVGVVTSSCFIEGYPLVCGSSSRDSSSIQRQSQVSAEEASNREPLSDTAESIQALNWALMRVQTGDDHGGYGFRVASQNSI